MPTTTPALGVLPLCLIVNTPVLFWRLRRGTIRTLALLGVVGLTLVLSIGLRRIAVSPRPRPWSGGVSFSRFFDACGVAPRIIALLLGPHEIGIVVVAERHFAGEGVPRWHWSTQPPVDELESQLGWLAVYQSHCAGLAFLEPGLPLGFFSLHLEFEGLVLLGGVLPTGATVLHIDPFLHILSTAFLLSLAAEVGREERWIEWTRDKEGGRGADVVALWENAPGLLGKVDEEAPRGAPKFIGQLDVDVLLIGRPREHGIRLRTTQLQPGEAFPLLKSLEPVSPHVQG